MTAEVPTSRDLVLTFKIEGREELGRTLTGFAGAVEDLSTAWSEIAERVIFPSIMTNFAMGGRPAPWTGLSDSYAPRKLKRWGPRPILVASGALMNAFSGPGASEFVTTAPEPRQLTITLKGNTTHRTGLFYGIFHTSRYMRRQKRGGGDKLPRRRFMMLQEEDVPKIISVIRQYIWSHAPQQWRRGMRGAGGGE